SFYPERNAEPGTVVPNILSQHPRTEKPVVKPRRGAGKTRSRQQQERRGRQQRQYYANATEADTEPTGAEQQPAQERAQRCRCSRSPGTSDTPGLAPVGRVGCECLTHDESLARSGNGKLAPRRAWSH